MKAALLPMLLAAEGESMLQHGDRFQSENAMLGPLSVGAAALAAVTLVTLIWLISKARDNGQQQEINHPWKLLRELSQAHRLSAAQERLLHRMIRHYQIEPPARLFLEPERFQAAAADAAFAREQRVIQGLKNRLFNGSAV